MPKCDGQPDPSQPVNGTGESVPVPLGPVALRRRWKSILVGAEPPGFAEHPAALSWRASLQAEASRLVRTMEISDDAVILWRDLADDGVSAHLTSAADRLRTIALAAALPGIPRRSATALSSAAAAGVGRLCPVLQREPLGNWWDHQIGVPLRTADIGMLLWEEHRDVVSAIVHSIRGATHVRAPGTDTGANLAWHTTVAVLTELLEDRVDVIHQLPLTIERALLVSENGDGIHPDGSFIQHGRLAYTGGYGISLLATIARLIRLTQRTVYAPDVGIIDKFLRWIQVGVRPYVFDGVLSDAVRGREIARSTTRGLDGGMVVAAALLELAPALEEAPRTELRGIAKGWIARAGAEQFFCWTPTRALVPGVVAEAEAVLTDRRVEALDEGSSPVAHTRMARAVHRSPGFALALTATTSSIDSSEHINGENLAGWYAGFGTRYLQTVDDPRPFDDAYWPTVDPLALPGLICDGVAPHPGEAIRSSSGPVRAQTMGPSMVFGWNLGSDDSAFWGHVSWLCHEHMVLMAASALVSDRGLPISATIENRLVSRGRTLRVDDRTTDLDSVADGTLDAVARAVHLEGVGGLLALDGTVLRVSVQTRVGSWAAINRSPGTPSQILDRRFVRISAVVERSPAHFAVLLLPAATPADLRRAAQEPPVTVQLTRSRHSAAFGSATLVDEFNGYPSIQSARTVPETAEHARKAVVDG